MNYNQLLGSVKDYVRNFFGNEVLSRLLYHNLSHTESVVSHTVEIASHYGLTDREVFIVTTAAWFHDTGYHTGHSENHEERGADIAAEFLKNEGISEDIIKEVRDCILATTVPQTPENLLQKIIGDADLYDLGTDEFAENNKSLRKEAEQTTGNKIGKDEWRKKTIKLLESHTYHTDYCQDLLARKKQKNLAKLLDKDLEESAALRGETTIPELPENKKQKADKPEKGIETMFRISSSNAQRLSDMADNKANIMITTTSIIMSVILSVLMRVLEDNAYLVIPTVMLLTICIVTMVFSILATRPKLPRGTFTQQDLDNKTANLLFFGNFYRMSYPDFSKGMQQMMDDKDFLYGSLIRDVYYQGIAIGRKYHLLRVAYNVFMYGIVLSVLAFVIASVFFGQSA